MNVIRQGLIIGSLILVAIQLGGIAASLRSIDRSLTILTIRNMLPEVFDEVMKEVEGDRKE